MIQRFEKFEVALKQIQDLRSDNVDDLVSDLLDVPDSPKGFRIAQRGLLKHEQQSGVYTFTYDGIQNASYALIEKKEREKFHLEIARRLSRLLEYREELHKHIFVLLDQFERGKKLIEQSEKYVAVKDQYDLCAALHTLAAEVYLITADEKRMEESIDAVMKNASRFIDKLGVLSTQVYALGSQDKAAAGTGLGKIDLLGTDVAGGAG